MIPVVLSFTDVAEEFLLSKKQIEGLSTFVIQDLTSAVANKWAKVAKRRLKGSRRQYLEGIYVGTKGKYVGFVALRGTLANMIEQGAPAFDMKAGFAKSNKITIKKSGSGWYLTIPFRFAAPDSLGDSSAFAGVLPKSVYNAVQKLAPKKTAFGGKSKSGTPLMSVPTEYAIPKVRKEIITTSKVFTEYKNKSSIYAGLVKEDKTYESGGGGKYVTFRRVSDKSDPMSWIHSGIQARNFAEQALQEVDIRQNVDISTDDYLKSIGFNT